MQSSSSLQPVLQDSPALRRRQISCHESVLTRPIWTKTTAGLRSLPRRRETNRLLKLNKLAEAKNLYIETILKGDKAGIILGSILIHKFMKSGSVEEAFQVFDKMPERNIVTWASMIHGCVQNGYEQEGLLLFIEMLESGVASNDYAFSAGLWACTKLRSLSSGEQIHSLLLRSGFSGDCGVSNCLIDFYCKSSCFDSAIVVFFQMVRLGIELNDRAITSVLGVSGFQLGEQIHGCLIKSAIDLSVFSASSLIEFYSRNYNISQAEKVFRNLKNRCVVTWSSMISCVLKRDKAEKALRLFVEMICENLEPNEFMLTTAIRASGLGLIKLGLQLHAWVIKLNVVADRAVLNALLSMYADAGEVEEFEKILCENEGPDIVSWCAAISGYFQNGFYEKSARLLREMHGEGMNPNEYGFSSALSSCANIPLFDPGRQFHCLALKSGCDLDLRVGNAVINLYAKCGCLDDATIAFDSMPTHDILSWNSLIHGYANHGFGSKSLRLFDEMMESESCFPDQSTFLGLLVGCNHMGYVDKAVRIFKSMDERYGVDPSPSHYACMVDIMGRAGKISEAIQIVEKMAYKPDALIWKSLLGSCGLHRNLELGKVVAERVIELTPKDSAGYVLLANLYSMHGEWGSAEMVRLVMEEKGAKKDAGWSWLEVRDEVVAFRAGDESHDEAEMIYRVLKELLGIMKDEAFY